MIRRSFPGGLTIALLVTIPAAAPAAAAMGVTAAGARVTRVTWDLGAAGGGAPVDARQTVAGAWVDLGLGAGLSARLESSGVAASGAGEELALGDGLSGSVLIGYEPPARPWRLQAGVGAPSGGDLTAAERDLLRLLAEPALSFPVDAPVRGWQVHLSALGGVPLRRGLGLYGGAAADWPAAYEAAPGEKLDPGARLLALAGLEAGDERHAGGLQITLAFDGAERLAGEEILGPRTVWGGSAVGRTAWLGLRGEAGARMTATDGLRWPSYTEFQAPPRRSDSARCWDLSIGLGLDREIMVGPGWRMRPLIRATHRRFLPEELPCADGWTRLIAPALELTAGELQIEAAAGWGRGSWREAGGEARGPGRGIDGAMLSLGMRWMAPAPTGRPVRVAAR